MFVFDNKLSSTLVVFLCLAFLIQPLDQAFATVNEDVNEPEITAESVALEGGIDEPEVEIESETETDSLNDSLTETEATSTDSEVHNNFELDDVAADETSISILTASTSDSDTASATTTILKTATSSEDVVVGDSATSTADTASSSSETATSSEPLQTVDDDSSSDTEFESSQDNDSRDNDSDESSAQTEVATTTSAEEAVKPITGDTNYYQFSKQSCVAVGDGTYHCSSEPQSSETTNEVTFADVGKTGNMEIFLVTKRGDIKQITENQYDDSSPFYDPDSQSIVWQRLIDDRYQIILFDIETQEERQLTFSRTNNMQPKASQAGVVWQAWDGNDWEVMFFDGAYTDQITDNRTQDVTPVIEDSYIVWSVLGSNEQEAQVYSIESGEVMSITDHDGGSIINPRFVLVYDTKYENGDIITQGFDPITGLSEQIAAQSAPEPIQIPEPDPIGEIRALLSNKSTTDEELESDTPVPSNDPPVAKKSTTSETHTIDLTNAATTTSLEDQASSSQEVIPFELTDFDIIITPSTSPAVIEEEELLEPQSTSTQE